MKLTLSLCCLLLSTLTVCGAEQYVICPPGQALVKYPDPVAMSQGIFDLRLTCVDAPTHAVLGTETEAPFGSLNLQFIRDPQMDLAPNSIYASVPCSIERAVLPDSSVTNQQACDPSYNGGVVDPVNLASFEPPDPLPMPNNARSRAVTSAQQAVLACLAKATNFTSPEFLDALQVSSEVRQWYAQGYRSDLQGLTRPDRPRIQFYETLSPSFLAVQQTLNTLAVTFRTGADTSDYATAKPFSIGYDCGCTLADYGGLVASWLIGTTQGFWNVPRTSWQVNNLPALNDGLSMWIAYRHDRTPEVYKYGHYVVRKSGGAACGTGTRPDCYAGQKLRSVMMFNETDTTKDGVYPFILPAGLSNYDGPTEWNLAAMFFGAVFYDLSQEAGLGDEKVNLLVWKTVSVVTNGSSFTLRQFGDYLLTAANALWPDPARPGCSLYYDHIRDVLRSRGIAVAGEATAFVNLPPALRAKVGVYGFGSPHPDAQPTTSSYGAGTYANNEYTETNSGPNDYVVYQFYKHSKYGPCDTLTLTDGTITNLGNGWSYNNDGTYYHYLQDRELQNLLLLAPGPRIAWVRFVRRCDTEREGPYWEDVEPFGFRVIKATKNGFAWKTTRVSTSNEYVGYQFDIVDPSVATLGPASYTWAFSDPTGTFTNLTGASVYFAARQDEPLNIFVSRVRGGETNTVELSEPGSYLDRADRPHYLVLLRTPASSVSEADKAHYANLAYDELVDGFNPGANAGVTALVPQMDGKLVAAGGFSVLGQQPARAIGRLEANGVLETGFSPALTGAVNCVAVQSDGKMLAGGSFTNLAGPGHANLVRLNSDGAVDATFGASASGTVNCLALQADGAVLVGGAFTSLAGVACTNLGRLTGDGLLDTNFAARCGGVVNSLAVQPDGKIIVGGGFTNIAGVNWNYLARLNPNGSADPGFQIIDEGSYQRAIGQVFCVLLQPDGKILVGGALAKPASPWRPYLGRLNPDGTLDSSFDPQPDGQVTSIALQADGKILVGGSFLRLGGQNCRSVGRLNADGTLDWTFNPGANAAVQSLALQADGSVLVGGLFSQLSAQPRAQLGRLASTVPAVQQLVFDGATVTWVRGGTSPEVSGCVFEGSLNGTDWFGLGAGTWTTNGWQLTNCTVGASASIRARGLVTGGYLNGSAWLVETLLRPVILVNDGAFGLRTNSFAFTTYGGLGRTVVIEASADLTGWTPISTNVLSSDRVVFSEAAAEATPRKFYRAGIQ